MHPQPEIEGDHVAMDADDQADSEERARALIALSTRYCWDSIPAAAPSEPERVILRTMDVGAWEDVLELECVFGRRRLVAVLRGASAGALTPRSWSFWHYRLGLADSDTPPPPRPVRRLG